METPQILWKRAVNDPAKQTGVKKQMNQCRKHSKTMVKKNDISRSTTSMRSRLGMSSSDKTRSKKIINNSKNGYNSQRKSLGGVDSRLTASMQVIGYRLNPDHHVSQSPSRPVKKRSKHRPHTSLGFTWNKSSAVDSLGAPRGFDIASYVKKHGTAQGIQIGINGRPVNDEYFQMYLEKCERELGENGEHSSSDSYEEIDISYLGTVSEGKLLQRQVPLCWEDQLKLAEPESIISPDCSKPKKKCVVIPQQPRNGRDSKMLSLSYETKIEWISSKTAVTLSWRENCILTGTPLSELNPSLFQQSKPLSPDMNTMTYRGKDSTSPSAAVDSNVGGSTRVSMGKVAEWLRQSEDNEQEEEVTSETNLDIISAYSSADLLGVWFKTADSATQKMLMRLSFEVFVTATEMVDQNLVELSTKAFTNLRPQMVSSTVSVIPVHLCRGESASDFIESGELKLTIICDEPRSLLFSTFINLPSEPEFQFSNTSNASTGPSPKKHHLIGSLEVPEHYRRRRTSYCNQDEDEDKTDLAALTRQFPDLKVMEYDDSESRNGLSAAPTSSSLPILEDELMKLNSIAVNITRNPVPRSSQIYNSVYGAVNQTPYALPNSSSNAGYGLGSVSRPLFRPVTCQDIKPTQQSHKSYTSIVSSWLTRYMK